MFFEGNINDWRPKANCVGCYLINENGATSHELLYLRRPSDDPFYPAQWGAPAGSIELGESLSQAAIREVLEETKVRLVLTSLVYIGHWRVIHPHLCFNYFLFLARFKRRPAITISREHSDYGWFSPRAALKLNLIEGEEKILRLVYNF